MYRKDSKEGKMKQSLLKKIGLGVGGFVVLMALGLLANKGSNNNNKEEIFQVSESKFPLSDYFFEEVKEEPKEKAKETPEVTTQEPTTQTSPNPSVSANPNIKDYSHLNNNLNQQNNTITHLQQVLQSPSKIKPKPKHTKEQLEFLNTRLKPLEPTKPATKPETEYGVDSFTNLKDFKNDITLILSKDRLETYDNLEQYKENLKLISLITPKISNLEIYLRNALDYCLTQIKGNEWVFDEVSLIPLIEELKDKKKEITHSLVLSKMSLEAVIKLIFFYKLEGVALDLRAYSLKAYYKDNKDTLLIKGRKQHLSNYAKA